MQEFQIMNDSNFQDIISNSRKVLIIFSSNSCGQCAIAKQNVQEIINSLQEFTVCECKVESAPEVVKKLQVSGVPQIKLFLAGEVVYTAFGIRPAQDLYYNLKMY